MLCINDHHTDPYFNLAAEEYVLRHFDEPCFMLWCNEPSVIVGRHQNTLAEINYDYVKKNNIKVVRRLSGGGAVFHDPGNVNFSFIENKPPEQQMDFQKYIKFILDVLRELEIDVRKNKRNDLEIEGKKISGNAEHVSRNRALHHGTLLFSSELAALSAALNVQLEKFNDKAVKSVRSGVTNIIQHLRHPMSMNDFRALMFQYFLAHAPDAKEYHYDAADLEAVCRLRDEKYATWEWNFGQSPEYSTAYSAKIGNGDVLEIRLNVQNGIIRHIRICSDFSAISDMSGLEQHICGTLHEKKAIRDRLKSVRLADYFANITEDELAGAMF